VQVMPVRLASTVVHCGSPVQLPSLDPKYVHMYIGSAPPVWPGWIVVACVDPSPLPLTLEGIDAPLLAVVLRGVGTISAVGLWLLGTIVVGTHLSRTSTVLKYPFLCCEH
jgi:hypothetical protein